MGVLIDSSILIEGERGRLDLAAHIAHREDEELFVSVITASELLHGVHRAASPEQRANRSAFVEWVLERVSVLDVDLATARAHARIGADLRAAGTPIGKHDSWLAAVCIAHGLSMVTANVREFERVPGLSVETWTDAW
ncbi:MAG: VapC toxin family PIN domain ribonuclease [Actinobacteria bacterium HGW-Actinobacteria-7]|nr:MAG: VapC toxin family PIN domain ribonuclease [Actinobacteria bacterium HGW-Actinobacteria-7]